MRRRRAFKIAVCIGLAGLLSLASGCRDDKPFGPKDRAELAVMYGDERSFATDYGRAFAALFPNVTIRVVPTGTETAESPDIALSNLAQYEERATAGSFVNLEPLIRSDQYDLDSIAPVVLHLLRGYGSGQLYGLAPVFSAQALYYNEDLFREKGVEPPVNRMSWAEVLRLAERFAEAEGGNGGGTDPDSEEAGMGSDGSGAGSQDGEVVGLTFPSTVTIASLLARIGQTEGLNLIDPVQHTLLLDSPKWKENADLLLRAFRSGAARISDEATGRTPDEMARKHLFAAGRSAMAVEDESLLSLLTSGMLERPIPFATVTAPVSTGDRNLGYGQRLDKIFSIHADSDQLDAAWEFLKFAAGEDRAKRQARTDRELVSRIPYAYERSPVYEAFYAPDANSESRPNGGLGYQDYTMLIGLIDEQLRSVLQGGQTWEEAVARMKADAAPLLANLDSSKTGER
ncbi:ABC transporter substrate-binding protein [Cohnella suwonensis]|uniref:ABC transporter substrate-binding protein n=1 Tax=Cohnella suwonensis TaxID=696072 RepID=A0ABW0M019_9BACL